MASMSRLALLSMLAVALLPATALAGTRLDCKGVVTFADAMTRAVRLSVDPDRGTVHMPSCAKYAELHRFCHGDLKGAHDHQFQFGGLRSRENTRLGIELHRDDAATYAGYDPPWLKVVFVGRCATPPGRWSADMR
jgi:hypothetical protein